MMFSHVTVLLFGTILHVACFLKLTRLKDFNQQFRMKYLYSYMITVNSYINVQYMGLKTGIKCSHYH